MGKQCSKGQRIGSKQQGALTCGIFSLMLANTVAFVNSSLKTMVGTYTNIENTTNELCDTWTLSSEYSCIPTITNDGKLQFEAIKFLLVVTGMVDILDNTSRIKAYIHLIIIILLEIFYCMLDIMPYTDIEWEKVSYL